MGCSLILSLRSGCENIVTLNPTSQIASGSDGAIRCSCAGHTSEAALYGRLYSTVYHGHLLSRQFVRTSSHHAIILQDLLRPTSTLACCAFHKTLPDRGPMLTCEAHWSLTHSLVATDECVLPNVPARIPRDAQRDGAPHQRQKVECTGRYQGCWKTLCTPD